MKYFNKFPLITYYLEHEEDGFFSRDIFKKLRFLESVLDNPALFEYYPISTFERPDVIAHKVYGNSHLHWVVLFANNVVDPKEWLMDTRTFNSYVDSRYDNPLGTHHYTRNGVVADLRAAQIGLNENPFGTVDSAPNADSFDVVDPNKYYPVSNEQYETETNDLKRIIRLIKPAYLNVFLNDVEKKLSAL